MASAATNGRVNGTTKAVQGSSGDVVERYLDWRAKQVNEHFPGALGVDDFLSRVEIALFDLGFTGENAIGRSCISCLLDSCCYTPIERCDHCLRRR